MVTLKLSINMLERLGRPITSSSFGLYNALSGKSRITPGLLGATGGWLLELEQRSWSGRGMGALDGEPCKIAIVRGVRRYPERRSHGSELRKPAEVYRNGLTRIKVIQPCF